MKIDLPLEIWFDIFAHVPRRILAGKVDQLCADRHFASIADFWFHREGKVTLKPFTLCQWIENIPHREVKIGQNWNYNIGEQFPLPEVPMPENIADFEQITIINMLNEEQFEFLQKMRRLLVNVSLFLGNFNGPAPGNNFDPFRPTLATFGQIVPPSLANGVNSIRASNLELLMEIQKSFKAIFMDARVLGFSKAGHSMGTFGRIPREYAKILADWLAAKRTNKEDNEREPKMLVAECKVHHAEFIEIIKEAFLEAQQPASFFVRFPNGGRSNRRQDGTTAFLTEQNAKTKECLTGRYVENFLLFSRFPMDAPREWVGEKEREMLAFDWEKQKQRIMLLQERGEEMPPFPPLYTD